MMIRTGSDSDRVLIAERAETSGKSRDKRGGVPGWPAASGRIGICRSDPHLQDLFPACLGLELHDACGQ